MKVELERKEIVSILERHLEILFAGNTAVCESQYSIAGTMTFKICPSAEEADAARALEGDDD